MNSLARTRDSGVDVLHLVGFAHCGDYWCPLTQIAAEDPGRTEQVWYGPRGDPGCGFDLRGGEPGCDLVDVCDDGGGQTRGGVVRNCGGGDRGVSGTGVYGAAEGVPEGGCLEVVAINCLYITLRHGF